MAFRPNATALKSAIRSNPVKAVETASPVRFLLPVGFGGFLGAGAGR
jgi:hypothetical protein